MEKIDGIDLKVEVKKAKEDALEAKRIEIQSAIDSVLDRIDDRKASIIAAKRNIETFEKQIAEDEETLKKIEGGDWEAIPQYIVSFPWITYTTPMMFR